MPRNCLSLSPSLSFSQSFPSFRVFVFASLCALSPSLSLSRNFPHTVTRCGKSAGTQRNHSPTPQNAHAHKGPSATASPSRMRWDALRCRCHAHAPGNRRVGPVGGGVCVWVGGQRAAMATRVVAVAEQRNRARHRVCVCVCVFHSHDIFGIANSGGSGAPIITIITAIIIRKIITMWHAHTQ